MLKATKSKPLKLPVTYAFKNPNAHISVRICQALASSLLLSPVSNNVTATAAVSPLQCSTSVLFLAVHARSAYL